MMSGAARTKLMECRLTRRMRWIPRYRLASWLCLLALTLPGTGLGASQAHEESAQDTGLANPYVRELWSNGRHELFHVALPAGETLDGHAASPRVIVPLAPVELVRVPSGEPVRFSKDEARWMTGSRVGAVRNESDRVMEYLVLRFPPSNYPPLGGDSQGNCSVLGGSSTALVHRPWLTACRSSASGSDVMRVDRFRLLYFETDAQLCNEEACHDCPAGTAWWLDRGMSVRPLNGERASLLVFRF